MNKYTELRNKLSNIIYLESAVEEIHKRVRENKISEEEGAAQLEEIEANGGIIPPLMHADWSELLQVIDKSEAALRRSIKFQLYLALAELPILIAMVSIALYCNWLNSQATAAIAIIGTILTAVTIHTFFILRVYQQGETAIERFSEKRVGILFLKIAANPRNSTANVDKLIDAATLMFLGHHVKPADPFGPDDMPNKK
jgi:hypothetical protein